MVKIVGNALAHPYADTNRCRKMELHLFPECFLLNLLSALVGTPQCRRSDNELWHPPGHLRDQHPCPLGLTAISDQSIKEHCVSVVVKPAYFEKESAKPSSLPSCLLGHPQGLFIV